MRAGDSRWWPRKFATSPIDRPRRRGYRRHHQSAAGGCQRGSRRVERGLACRGRQQHAGRERRGRTEENPGRARLRSPEGSRRSRGPRRNSRSPARTVVTAVSATTEQARLVADVDGRAGDRGVAASCRPPARCGRSRRRSARLSTSRRPPHATSSRRPEHDQAGGAGAQGAERAGQRSRADRARPPTRCEKARSARRGRWTSTPSRPIRLRRRPTRSPR